MAQNSELDSSPIQVVEIPIQIKEEKLFLDGDHIAPPDVQNEPLGKFYHQCCAFCSGSVVISFWWKEKKKRNEKERKEKERLAAGFFFASSISFDDKLVTNGQTLSEERQVMSSEQNIGKVNYRKFLTILDRTFFLS